MTTHATHTPAFDPTCSTCWSGVTSDNITAADPVSCGPGCSDGRHTWEYADPLTADEEPPDFGMQQFTRGWEPDRSGAVIVWLLGAILLALLTCIAVMAWRVR